MMRDRIPSESIGGRAYEEVLRVFGSPYHAASALLVAASTPYMWLYKNGTPRADTLAIMHDAGCDILYILTGRKQNGEK